MNLTLIRISPSQVSIHSNSLSHGSTCHAHLMQDDKHYFIKFKRNPITKQWDRMALCEVVASRLAKYFGLDAIEYNLCLVDTMDGLAPVVGCISEYYYYDEVVYTAQNLCDAELGPYHVSAESLRKLGYSTYIDRLIAFDYIIGNKDRHTTNIEFIAYDIDEIYAAPIFDCGTSLLKTFAPYPAMWSMDQITNNFLTDYHTQRAFSSIASAVSLFPLAGLDWESEIFYDLESYITSEEKQMITAFVTNNYNELLKRGLIDERRV